MNKKFLTIIIILLVLILGVLGAYVFLMSGDKEEGPLDQTVSEQVETLPPTTHPLSRSGRPSSGGAQLPQETGGGTTNSRTSGSSGSGVVQTDAGDKYGVDVAGLVSFINANSTIKKALKGYSSINLVIDTGTEQVDLVVSINSSGSVSKVADGHSATAAFTIKFPLSDLQEVVNNYENLNILSVLSLLSKTEITPESAKKELLGKIMTK